MSMKQQAAHASLKQRIISLIQSLIIPKVSELWADPESDLFNGSIASAQIIVALFLLCFQQFIQS